MGSCPVGTYSLEGRRREDQVASNRSGPGQELEGHQCVVAASTAGVPWPGGECAGRPGGAISLLPPPPGVPVASGSWVSRAGAGVWWSPGPRPPPPSTSSGHCPLSHVSPREKRNQSSVSGSDLPCSEQRGSWRFCPDRRLHQQRRAKPSWLHSPRGSGAASQEGFVPSLHPILLPHPLPQITVRTSALACNVSSSKHFINIGSLAGSPLTPGGCSLGVF